MNIITTPTHFADWLRSKGADAVVGKRMLPCECPLACYLQSLNPDVTPENVRIGANIYTLDGYEAARGLDMPKWAARFVQKIDEARYVEEGSPHNRDDVSGAEAALALLTALDGMQADEGEAS